MTETTEIEIVAAATDRRRPGRLADVNPELIPLLRSPAPETTIEFEDVDQNAAMRGLMFGLLFSAPIWAAIAYGGSFFLSR